MQLHEYESRLNRPVMMKIPEFQRNERLKHIITSEQYDIETLEHLSGVATMIKNLAGSKEGCDYLSSLLSHRRAMLYFTQASTRTFLSFMAACQILGLNCNEIRDSSVSSEYKGESPFDSVRMFSSYFDIIIMRSRTPDFAECCAYLMNDLEEFNQRSVPIINGGAGADEHPTQALLDMYTILLTFAFRSPKDSSKWSRFDELENKYPGLTRGPANKTYCFCGDIGRGRTVRSLANILSLYENVTMYFVSPDHPKLRLAPEVRDKLTKRGVKVLESDDLNEVIDKVDLLYMTRIQHEHDSKEDAEFFAKLDASKFRLDRDKVSRMKWYAAIMHPFPRNEEIPFGIDQNPRALYFRQARNGMWARAALIAYLFDMDGKIVSRHQKTFSEFHDYNVKAL
jgi:aspartate carbamoyltransferase catalytic subunit